MSLCRYPPSSLHDHRTCWCFFFFCLILNYRVNYSKFLQWWDFTLFHPSFTSATYSYPYLLTRQVWLGLVTGKAGFTRNTLLVWFHHISRKQVVSPGYRKFRLLCNYTWEREHCCQWHSSAGRSFFSFGSCRLYQWNKTKKKLPPWPEWLKSKTVFVSPVLLSWSLSDSENIMSYLVFPMLWTAALYGYVDKGFMSGYHSNMEYNACRSRYKRQR